MRMRYYLILAWHVLVCGSRLPPFTRKLSPPGYWKDRLTGKKEIHILVRSDRYHLEPISKNKEYIVLEDFDLRIRYVGRIRWEGKQ
jgi:putative transposase